MTRLSVIIASKDRAGYLDPALRSMSEQVAAPSFEVIVVDNGSSDATPQVVERARDAYGFEISYLYEERPNRAAARNRGISVAQGEIVVFVDDDVWLPVGFLAAHDRAHNERRPTAVSGPIINVGSYHDRPKPTLANFSRAFFCTCNVSVPLRALRDVHGFDQQFHLYGWEDTELGVRLRERGVRSKFCWDAYIYHIKPPAEQTLDVTLVRTLEKAQMAAQFIRKNRSRRARLATGAHSWNFWRARALAPKWMLPLYAGFAADERMPSALRAVARYQLLDGMYVHELQRGLQQ